MKTFNIYKKRDGQSWKEVGEYFADSFEEAKKQFAKNCWYDLLEGKHGDNYVHLEPESDGVTESGIYYLNGRPNEELDCFFPASNLDEGIEFFNEDVYSWEIRNVEKMYRLMNHDSSHTESIFDSYSVEEHNLEFETNYNSVEEAVEADPEYLFTEEQMNEYLKKDQNHESKNRIP